MSRSPKRSAVPLLAIGAVAFALAASVPAIGGTSAHSAASLAAQVKKLTKSVKAANKKATAALALAKSNGPGKPGPAGPAGAQGAAGTPGAPGEPGVAPAPEAVKTIDSFNNTWVKWGNSYPVTYWKDLSGVVHLSGGLKGGTVSVGTASVPIFTLPAGYKPAQIQYQPIVSTDSSDVPIGGAYVEICDAAVCGGANYGAVSVFGADNYYVSLDGVTFRAG